MPEHRFRGVDLNSEGHVRLCEALAAADVLFCFEVRTCIPGGDPTICRRLDLLVIGPHSLLNVEVDGARHNRTKKRECDYERDRLLSRHMRTLRFTHEAVLASPEQVVDCIQRELEQDARSLTLQLSRLQDTQGG
ncbi:MAG: DUF559 domain-containing protein [Synechococcus sp. BS301-5m-G54]|nr:DUF559 domain-containing protein [Synechococcus sp. BS301-5m-G54]MBL6796685.1 DUF559 domain-containing protein [Synechococcus sp. BS307-5m-G34]